MADFGDSLEVAGEACDDEDMLALEYVEGGGAGPRTTSVAIRVCRMSTAETTEDDELLAPLEIGVELSRSSERGDGIPLSAIGPFPIGRVDESAGADGAVGAILTVLPVKLL